MPFGLLNHQPSEWHENEAQKMMKILSNTGGKILVGSFEFALQIMIYLSIYRNLAEVLYDVD